MSAGNFEALKSFLDDGLPEELVRFAVDEACAHGAASWSYVERILNRYIADGIRTLQQAKTAKASYQRDKGKHDELPPEEKQRRQQLNEEWGGDLL